MITDAPISLRAPLIQGAGNAEIIQYREVDQHRKSIDCQNETGGGPPTLYEAGNW
jgi:hypothetical protein